jgi:hypothetical protein
MPKYFWTCCKCYGNEYSESARITHICNEHLREKPKENKLNIEEVKIVKETPPKLTQKKGVKSGRKSKKSNSKLD